MNMNRDELRKEAKKAGVAGRGRMTKAELQAALLWLIPSAYVVTGDSLYHAKALRRAKRYFLGETMTHRVAERSRVAISFCWERSTGHPKTVTVTKYR